MARAQSQFLRIYDGSNTYQRWQSYYSNSTITLSGQRWDYQPFAASGFTSGVSGDEASISITAPATGPIIAAFESAIRDGRMCELLMYQFDSLLGNITPQVGQILVARYIGQVVSGRASLTQLTVQLGTPLSPIGAQIPPRTFTTALIGKGCKL